MTEPVVIFEMRSPSTTHTHLVIKNANTTPHPPSSATSCGSKRRDGATIFVRKGEDWVSGLVHGGGAVLHLPEAGNEVPWAALYFGPKLSIAGS